MSKTVVNRFSDINSVADNTAAKLIEKVASLLAAKDEVHLVLTGGTVGIATLASLCENPAHTDIDFTRVNFWWGDERFVAADSSDRNALQAKNALLKNLKLDDTKVHEFPSAENGLELQHAAAEFAAHVETVKPHFDVVLLEIGRASCRERVSSPV